MVIPRHSYSRTVRGLLHLLDVVDEGVGAPAGVVLAVVEVGEVHSRVGHERQPARPTSTEREVEITELGMDPRELARRRATRRAVLSRDLHDAYGTVNVRELAAGRARRGRLVMIPWLLVARTTSRVPLARDAAAVVPDPVPRRELLTGREQRTPRRFEFVPTPSVLSARARAAFISCPACRRTTSGTSSTSWACGSCGADRRGVVYANPPVIADRQYFDVDAVGQHDRPRDRELFRDELGRRCGRSPSSTRRCVATPPERSCSPGARSTKVSAGGGTRRNVVRLDDRRGRATQPRRRRDADRPAITSDTNVLILNELLEACPLAPPSCAS